MDVLVLPTWREGLPTVNIEAQAAGKPVVTTRATGAIDSVQDGKTGLLVPVGDASALAHAVGSLLSDNAKRKEMGRRGLEWVTREFSRGKILPALTREYHNLMIERLGFRRRESTNCDTTERGR
jgi:glycosyltransferase involved in cell wall biosynthesis